jgi:hypothetical protein
MDDQHALQRRRIDGSRGTSKHQDEQGERYARQPRSEVPRRSVSNVRTCGDRAQLCGFPGLQNAAVNPTQIIQSAAAQRLTPLLPDPNQDLAIRGWTLRAR